MRDDDKAGRRDYGLGDSTRYVKGSPRLLRIVSEIDGVQFTCPNCGCKSAAEIEVDISNHPVIKEGIGRYLGCPACPWASPMAMVSL